MYVVSSDSPLLADDETYLAHYGIKGQKWGIRRTPEQLRRARGTKPWEGKNTPPAATRIMLAGARVWFDIPRHSEPLAVRSTLVDIW